MKEKVVKTKKIKIAMIILIVLTIFIFIFIHQVLLKGQSSYATATDNKNQNVKISKAKKVNIEEYIQKEILSETTEEIITEEIELEYITEYIQNQNIPKGTINVLQEGRTGLQQNTIIKSFTMQGEIKTEYISSNIIKAPINKIVEIGSGVGQAVKYTAKTGDTVYVTSDRLSVYIEENQESQKVGTLNRNEIATIIEIEKDWYKIETKRVIGWVKSEGTTNINPNSNTVNSKENTEKIQKLNFNMALNKPSGLSLEQFKKILTDNKDKNNIFSQNADYFYYIEKQYNINGIFVAAVGIHESSWGTSSLAKNKKNLFGYGANDSNPYNNAYNFENYSEGIDLLARVFSKYYLNPKGTTIYNGEVANGRYYNGNTLSAVNKKYASDSNWANAVYQHMKYLYNKL